MQKWVGLQHKPIMWYKGRKTLGRPLNRFQIIFPDHNYILLATLISFYPLIL